MQRNSLQQNEHPARGKKFQSHFLARTKDSYNIKLVENI